MTQTDKFGIICHILRKLNMDNLHNPEESSGTMCAREMEEDKLYQLLETAVVTNIAIFVSGAFMPTGGEKEFEEGQIITPFVPRGVLFKDKNEDLIEPPDASAEGLTWVSWTEPISVVISIGQIPSDKMVSQM